MYVNDIFDDPNPDPMAAESAVSQSELDFETSETPQIRRLLN
jgi:hypothetical protein